MNKETEHKIKTLIKNLDKTKSKIEDLLSNLNKELKGSNIEPKIRSRIFFKDNLKLKEPVIRS